MSNEQGRNTGRKRLAPTTGLLRRVTLKGVADNSKSRLATYKSNPYLGVLNVNGNELHLFLVKAYPILFLCHVEKSNLLPTRQRADATVAGLKCLFYFFLLTNKLIL